MQEEAVTGVWCRSRESQRAEAAGALAVHLGVDLCTSAEVTAECDLVVVFDDAAVSLHEPGSPGRDLIVDLAARNLRPGTPGLSKKQPLARAIGTASTVIDATAGLGQDAMLLACLGYDVTAIERSAILCALLKDGLHRAAGTPGLIAEATHRLRLLQADARTALRSMTADVVYLDPMYPPKRKRSALPPRRIRLVRRIVGADVDSLELLTAARACARQRVVVKRPRHADPLAEAPDFTIEGKLARYDVYLASTTGTAFKDEQKR